MARGLGLRVGSGVYPLGFGDLTISWGGFEVDSWLGPALLSVLFPLLFGRVPREGLLEHLATCAKSLTRLRTRRLFSHSLEFSLDHPGTEDNVGSLRAWGPSSAAVKATPMRLPKAASWRCSRVRGTRASCSRIQDWPRRLPC